MADCVFCKIIKGEIPSPRVYEDEYVIAIDDITPAAKVHSLIIPKTHYADILELNDDTDGRPVIRALHRAVSEVAARKGVNGTGFRLIANCGADGGQSVPHLHYHVLGGQHLGARLV